MPEPVPVTDDSTLQLHYAEVCWLLPIIDLELRDWLDRQVRLERHMGLSTFHRIRDLLIRSSRDSHQHELDRLSRCFDEVLARAVSRLTPQETDEAPSGSVKSVWRMQYERARKTEELIQGAYVRSLARLLARLEFRFRHVLRRRHPVHPARLRRRFLLDPE